MPATPPPYLFLGRVLRPHGVRGELRLSTLTDYPERVARLKHVYLSQKPDQPADAQPYTVESVRLHQDYILLKLAEITDRDEADRLRDYMVMVDLPSAVPLDEDEVYLYQLIGLRVQTPQGEVIGTVTDVFETGANDVYVVQHPQHGEVLIPAHKETVVDIQPEAGIILMNLPEGLLPDDEA